jgi:hypothetical protein
MAPLPNIEELKKTFPDVAESILHLVSRVKPFFPNMSEKYILEKFNGLAGAANCDFDGTKPSLPQCIKILRQALNQEQDSGNRFSIGTSAVLPAVFALALIYKTSPHLVAWLRKKNWWKKVEQNEAEAKELAEVLDADFIEPHKQTAGTR